ncbi:hypothetical protein [Chitinophaga defluvii]|uniref:Endosialidase-like protein n=1 Tax=Chitinophaga defluvii TaxID=3163343 RepID=A0ABV2T2U9_9BACT
MNRKFKTVSLILFMMAASTVSKAQWATSGTGIYNTNTGNVGLGTTSPQSLLHVNAVPNSTVARFTQSNIPFGDAYLNIKSNVADPNTFVPSIVGRSNASRPFALTLIAEVEDITPSGLDISYGAVMLDGRSKTGTKLVNNNILAINNANQNLVLVKADGSVGIGTNSPTSTLDVNGAIKGKMLGMWEGTDKIGFIGRGAFSTGGWSATPNILAITYHARDFAIGGWRKSDSLWGGARLYINSDNGNVLIGKTSQTNTSYKLDVNGNIRANKIVVNTTGADFVFEPDYKLPALQELEMYILQHRHLPGIAPAAQMQKEGVDLGEHQTQLLQKIEELTLHLIQLDKKVTAQQQVIAEQAKQLEALKK